MRMKSVLTALSAVAFCALSFAAIATPVTPNLYAGAEVLYSNYLISVVRQQDRSL